MVWPLARPGFYFLNQRIPHALFYDNEFTGILRHDPGGGSLYILKKPINPSPAQISELRSSTSADVAMNSIKLFGIKEFSKFNTMPKIPGGIDLNPAQMSMQVKEEGEDFKFDFNGTGIDAAQVTGATFTIHTMTPATNMPLILGLIQEPGERI